MVQVSLQELEHLAVKMAEGDITSELTLKAEILKKVIYKQADLIAVGTKVVAMQGYRVLDNKWTYPTEFDVEYPVPEGGRAERKRVEWVEFTLSLQKAETSIFITDEARLRGMANYQTQMSVRRAAEGFARKIDNNILTNIVAGKGTEVTLATNYEWDGSSADIAGDIMTAFEWILGNSNASLQDARNLAVIMPVAVYGELLKLQEIENIKTNLRDYLGTSFGVDFFPTRDTNFADTAIVMIRGVDTAIHGYLTGGIPLTEHQRIIGLGEEYVIRKYFATKIIPESSTQTTSNRIYKINNVVS